MTEQRDLRDGLDRLILRRMAKACHLSRWHPPGDYAVYIRGLTCDEIDYGLARAVCRNLTDRGFASYMHGLFDEQGMTAGAGYYVTWKGWRYLSALDEIAAPSRAADGDAAGATRPADGGTLGRAG